MEQKQTQGGIVTRPGYDPGGCYDEIVSGAARHGGYLAALRDRVFGFDGETLRQRAQDAEQELFNLGITFTVYTERDAIDRILPFDVIPRPIVANEWREIDNGIQQRVAALNLFLRDVYGPQKILKDGIVPKELVLENSNYRPEMHDIAVPQGTFIHISGTDLVRDHEGNWAVLEDNGRVPSGVSYVIENRTMMLRALPDLAEGFPLRPVGDYGLKLAQALSEVAPDGVDDPQIVLMSPGVFNSAYFEHVFLAREMGVPLVEGRDLLVEDDKVFMKTVRGLQRVHVVYRRIDDAFLDPQAFRPESLLGVSGIMRAYAKGNVTLANAVGTGVADDKAVYAYVPEIIRYYLDQDPILPNIDTRYCGDATGLKYTLDNLDKLVVKPVGGSGGYGVCIGPRASQAELDETREAVKADPSGFISQPMIQLSVCPTVIGETLEPRHVDLRPFAVTGRDTWVLPGGLSRVALRKNSLVVNSSRGGGSKDTWVLG